MTAPTDKRASKEVDVKKECGVLADVYKHRTALHFLKNEKEAREAILKTIDPEAADQIKGLVEKDERFTELDYHFVEKIRNCEQRILNRLRADKFQGVADLVEAVKDKNYPNTVAFANLLGTVDLNLRHAIRAGLVENDDSMKDGGRRLTAEALRTQGTAGHAIDEISKTVWKDGKPDDFPASWFDRSSEVISYEFGPIPDAKDFPRVDLGARRPATSCSRFRRSTARSPTRSSSTGRRTGSRAPKSCASSRRSRRTSSSRSSRSAPSRARTARPRRGRSGPSWST